MNKLSKRSHPKGMTLIELLIVVAIGAVIMIALLELYMAGQKYFYNQDAKAEAIEDSRYPITWISRDVREAYRVNNGSASVTINGMAFTTSPTCLILEVPALDTTGHIAPGSNIDYIAYSLTNRRLSRIIESTTGAGRVTGSRVLADNMSSFQIRYFQSDGAATPVQVTSAFAATNVVEISLASSMKGLFRGGQSFNEGLTTQVKLRNKT